MSDSQRKQPPAPLRAPPPPLSGARPAGQRQLPPIKPRPPHPAFDPAPDPLDESRYPGDIEGDAKEELDQLSAGFRERIKNENDRFKVATDGSYYFVACFVSGEQVDAFLEAMGMDRLGGDLFVDGLALADRCGVKLPEVTLPKPKTKAIDPKLSRLVAPSLRK